MDYQRRDLDLWEKIIEKAVNTEVKASLQPLFETKEINSKYSKGYKLSAKKKKDEASQEYQDGNKDKNKAKSYNLLPANTSQPQT